MANRGKTEVIKERGTGEGKSEFPSLSFSYFFAMPGISTLITPHNLNAC